MNIKHQYQYFIILWHTIILCNCLKKVMIKQQLMLFICYFIYDSHVMYYGRSKFAKIISSQIFQKKIEHSRNEKYAKMINLAKIPIFKCQVKVANLQILNNMDNLQDSSISKNSLENFNMDAIFDEVTWLTLQMHMTDIRIQENKADFIHEIKLKKGASTQIKFGKLISQNLNGNIYRTLDGYLIKEINMQKQSQSQKKYMKIELACFEKLRQNPRAKYHNIQMIEYTDQQNIRYIQLQTCIINLKQFIKIKNINQQQILVDILIQILFGYIKIHQCKIIHRNLKLNNILITPEGRCRIGDFGLAKFVENYQQKINTIFKTSMYSAPQVLQNLSYTYKCDIWSLGVILYELITKRLPWEGSDKKQLLENIKNKQLDFEGEGDKFEISEQIKSVIRGMLKINQDQRFNLVEIIKGLKKYRSRIQASKPKPTDISQSDKQVSVRQSQINQQSSCHENIEERSTYNSGYAGDTNGDDKKQIIQMSVAQDKRISEHQREHIIEQSNFNASQSRKSVGMGKEARATPPRSQAQPKMLAKNPSNLGVDWLKAWEILLSPPRLLGFLASILGYACDLGGVALASFPMPKNLNQVEGQK